MNSTDYAKIGPRIAKVRRSHKITQESLAEMLDVTPKHVSHVENATSSFSLKHLIHFCELFDCSFDYLIFGKDNNDMLSKLPIEIIEVLNHGKSDERERLSRYLELYVEMMQGREK